MFLGKEEIQKYVEEHVEELSKHNNFLVKAERIVVHEGEQLNKPVVLQVFSDKDTGKPILIREV
jgi:hypothetical protein